MESAGAEFHIYGIPGRYYDCTLGTVGISYYCTVCVDIVWRQTEKLEFGVQQLCTAREQKNLPLETKGKFKESVGRSVRDVVAFIPRGPIAATTGSESGNFQECKKKIKLQRIEMKLYEHMN